MKDSNESLTNTDQESIISSKDISRMTEIIEDMYDIKKLTREELIKNLLYYNVIVSDDMKINDLRTLLLKKIKRKQYKIKRENKILIQELKEEFDEKTKKAKIETKITKKELIEQIKVKYPTKKGLTSKTKDELFIILNEEQLPKTKKETKITKKDLLEQIKAKYPALKSLAAKKKDELIKILYNK